MRFPGRTQAAPRGTTPRETVKVPLYPRLLRLRHVHPNAWQRAALGEGALAVAVVLVLADVASAWTLLALPLSVAVIVKAHDVLAGLLARTPSTTLEDANGAAPGEGSGADGVVRR